MNLPTIKKWGFAILCFATALFSEEAVQKATATFDQGYGVCENQFAKIYSAPARVDVNCNYCDMFLYANFLYWQAKEKGLDYAIFWSKDQPHTPSFFEYNNFKYKPGFKVGIGFFLPHYDNWDIDFNYTWLCLSENSSTVVKEGYYLMPPSLTDLSLRSAKTLWKLKYNIFNLEFGRSFYLGTKLTFRPNFGLIGGWIDQSLFSSYTLLTDGSIVNSYTDQRTYLVGPKIGLNANYLLGLGFKAFGKGVFSLFYQNFKDSYKIKVCGAGQVK